MWFFYGPSMRSVVVCELILIHIYLIFLPCTESESIFTKSYIYFQALSLMYHVQRYVYLKSVSQGIKQRACPEFPESGSVLVGLQCQVSEWSLSNFVQNIPPSNFSRAVLYQFIQSSPVLNFSKPPCIEFFPE